MNIDAACRRTFFTGFDLTAFESPGNLNATVVNIYHICHTQSTCFNNLSQKWH